VNAMDFFGNVIDFLGNVIDLVGTFWNCSGTQIGKAFMELPWLEA
jgi:hypothetical protein